mmetsp:Transcript_32029/g.57353  ORF Transcript_32029/g.57353 Transcript_32029/m.57353 type:complete len:519 (-) Transcript_32029:153-1709(-)
MAARAQLSRSQVAVSRPSARTLSAQRNVSRSAPLRRRLVTPPPVSHVGRLAVNAGVSHPGEEAEGTGQGSGSFDPAMRLPTSGMAKGSFMGGGATLERSKLDMTQKLSQSAPKLDDAGGGGNNGGKIFNGGGGDGGDGDDDDYFDEGEDGDGDGDDGFFRTVLPELYDQVTLNAVMSEWFRAVTDLPIILRQAVSMGLFSSAQLVRFLSMDVRPGVARAVSRNMSPGFSREFIGRLMADPAFAQKMLIEQTITAGGSLFVEWRQRGDNFVKELDYVLLNTLTLCAANAALVWTVAPNRSHGGASKLPWEGVLSGLPNNVFDKSGPLRAYSNTTRAAGFFAKAAELSAIGVLAGAAQSGLGHGLTALRQTQDKTFKPTVPVPDVARSAAGLGAFMGISSNVRYQLLGGVDRYLFDHSTMLWSYLAVSSALRTGSQYIGNGTRLLWQGLPTQMAPVQQRRRRVVRRVVRKPSASSSSSTTPSEAAKTTAEAAPPSRQPSGGFQMSASTAAPMPPAPPSVV